MIKEVKDNMDNIRAVLGNATMAYSKMDINIDAKKITRKYI